MSKRTMQLSQIVDAAVNENHPSPNIKQFETISKIIDKIDAAVEALRNQLIGKMRAYINKFISKRELFYCLCLSDYLVQHQTKFRIVVTHPDYLKMFEKIADFDRIKKTSKKPNLITGKAMKLVQIWGGLYVELKCYKDLFEKYLEKGVVFLYVELPSETTNTQPEMVIESLVEEIEECMCIIADTLEEKSFGISKSKAEKALLKRAESLQKEFNRCFVQYNGELETKQENIDRYTKIDTDFRMLVGLLTDAIGGEQPENDLYRTFTTGHLSSKQTDKEEEKEKEKEKEKKEVKSVVTHTKPVSIQGQPKKLQYSNSVRGRVYVGENHSSNTIQIKPSNQRSKPSSKSSSFKQDVMSLFKGSSKSDYSEALGERKQNKQRHANLLMTQSSDDKQFEDMNEEEQPFLLL
ncbi:VHS domain-containing protein [Entamoeba marina]